jgi:hypothetical protein
MPQKKALHIGLMAYRKAQHFVKILKSAKDELKAHTIGIIWNS